MAMDAHGLRSYGRPLEQEGIFSQLTKRIRSAEGTESAVVCVKSLALVHVHPNPAVDEYSKFVEPCTKREIEHLQSRHPNVPAMNEFTDDGDPADEAPEIYAVRCHKLRCDSRNESVLFDIKKFDARKFPIGFVS